MHIRLSEIRSILAAEQLNGEASFTSISTDTRNLQPGALFIALKGLNFDGHEFISLAEEKGAAAALVSQATHTALPVLQVADTRYALGQLAGWWRQRFQIPVIGLTGSCGKTTVKEMIRNILSQKGPVLANIGTFNNEIGVPLTLLNLNEQHRFAVVEMGANHKHEISYLTQIVRPKIALINNIASAHLEGFENIEGVARAKFEIFEGLEPTGTVLLNREDHFSQWIRDRLGNRHILSFGLSPEADIFAQNIRSDGQNHFSFLLSTPKGEVDVQLQVIGQHNILNALAAASAAYALDIDLATIKRGLEQNKPVAGRLVPAKGYQDSIIIDDTYNANPLSVKAAIHVLAQYQSPRILVLGDMKELGVDSRILHAEIGAYAKEIGIDALYAYGQAAQISVEQFGPNGFHFSTQEELVQALKPQLSAHSTVLVKGSRSMQMEKIVSHLI